MSVTEAGSRFVFGSLFDVGPSFLMSVFPIIIFMGSVFGVLYHVGVVQWLVGALARVLGRTMRISGAGLDGPFIHERRRFQIIHVNPI